MAGRKKKAQMLEDEAAEAKARQENKAPGSSTSDRELLAESIPKPIGGATATTTTHIVDCLNDDDVYVKKEEMAIAGKEEKAKEQQGSPENVVEKKWVGEPIDITGGNNHKVAITSPNKLPESAPITNEEAAAAHPVATAGGLGLRFSAGIQDAAENAEEAAPPATQDTLLQRFLGYVREIK